jgi:hypothetical protein
MRHIPFDQIAERELRLLARSVLEAPADERDSPQEMLSLIKSGVSHLFTIDDGIVLCRKVDKTLMLDALCCETSTLGFAEAARRYSGLAEDLQKLAAEWECDKIKTVVYTDRLASVIQHLGGRVESRTMTLAVE